MVEWAKRQGYGKNKWWFEHLPKADGHTQGIANNWWLYVIDPNVVR